MRENPVRSSKFFSHISKEVIISGNAFLELIFAVLSFDEIYEDWLSTETNP